jgi:hypothetical protein
MAALSGTTKRITAYADTTTLISEPAAAPASGSKGCPC